MCAVIFAGGVGDRLGFEGIKLSIFVDRAKEETFLEFYLEHLKHYGLKTKTSPMLVLMVSSKTEHRTVELIENLQIRER